MTSQADTSNLEDVVRAVAEESDAEVYLYFGSLDRPFDDRMIDACRGKPTRLNALLFLETYGGDPDAAYRITRYIKARHSGGKILLVVDRVCKSAGTLVALGADILIMSDRAELGPLDTQVEKPDEVGGHQSGLVVVQTLRTLEEESFQLFENCFLKLRTRSGLRITTRTAAELACAMTTGLFGPTYSQIDPLRLGENYRALQVALMYGDRLSTDNVKAATINQLISSFPSHGFVIDRAEASTLFNEVRELSDAQQELSDLVRAIANEALHGSIHGDEAFVAHLTGEASPTGSKEGEEEKDSQSESEEREEEDNGEQLAEESDETPTLASGSEQTDGGNHQENRSSA